MALFRRDVLQTAEQLVAKGKIEGALKEYRRYLDKSPDDTATLNRVGDLFIRLRKNDDAIRYYRQTAQRYASDGFYVKAIAVYKKIHRIEPGRLDIHERLAELYQRQGLISDARNHYYQVADHYLRDDDAKAAIQVYEKLIELEPDNPTHRLRLADLYRTAGQTREALRSYGGIATLMLTHGHVPHALQVYERAFQVDPRDLDFVAEAVSSIRRAGGEEPARRLLAVAVSLNPKVRDLEDSLGLATPELATLEPAEPIAPPVRPAPQPPRPPTQPPATSATLANDDAGADAEPSAERGLFAPSTSDSGSFSFAPDLEDLELGLGAGAGVKLESPSVGGAEFELIDEPAPLPLLGSGAVTAPSSSRATELLAEADVFLKYGLTQKAMDRLSEVLELAPETVGAYQRLIPLLLDADNRQEAERRLDGLRALAGEDRDRALLTLTAVLEPSAPAGESIEAKRPETPDSFEEIDIEVPDEELDSLPPPAAQDDSFVLDLDADDQGLEPQSPVLVPRPAKALEEPFDELAGFRVASEVAAGEEAGRVDEADAGVSERAPAAPVPEPAPEATESGRLAASVAKGVEAASSLIPMIDDETPAWLDDAAAGDQLLEEEQEFFDLAAELQEALAGSAEVPSPRLREPQEQSLEEIVDGFRRGVAENISERDSDTHYNLGIAYREMALLDEAIGEFQISAKSPEFLIDSCAMLGLCFRDKGLPDLAVKWYRKALESETISEEQRCGMLYDLGSAYEALEDRAAAYEAFAEVYGKNRDYRDVSERVAQLQSS